MSDFTSIGSAAADVVARLPRQSAAPVRYVDTRDSTIALVEVADGDALVVGPLIDHATAEDLAHTLLSVTGPGAWLPPIVHKLALAYLSARQVERLP